MRPHAIKTALTHAIAAAAALPALRRASDANDFLLGLVDIFAAIQAALEFIAGVDANYAETVLPLRDGLPKLRDFPKESGGSGAIMAE